MDRFRDDYVTLEWVTNEFSEQLQEGAKREVPAIANLPKYREMVSTLVKRRTTDEPMVSAYVRIPVPTERDVIVEWDKEHLAFYLKVAEEFYGWYFDLRAGAGIKTSTWWRSSLASALSLKPRIIHTSESGTLQPIPL